MIVVFNLSSLADPVYSDKMSEYLSAYQLEVTGFGSWKGHSNARIDNFIVSEYELSYLSRGRLKMIVPGGEYVCEEGSLFLFEPFTPYSVEKIYEGDMDLYNIFFDIYPEYLQSELMEQLFHAGLPLWQSGDLPNVEAQFRDTFSLCSHSPQGTQMLVECLLKTCLVYMLRASKALPSIPNALDKKIITRQNQVVKAALGYIRENLSQPIKLYALCASINISESYLYKCFVNVTHVSPQRYILQYKVKRAKQLMRFQGLSVEEAAAELGFSSSYHLSSVFKNVLGQSPTKHLHNTGFF